MEFVGDHFRDVRNIDDSVVIIYKKFLLNQGIVDRKKHYKHYIILLYYIVYVNDSSEL